MLRSPRSSLRTTKKNTSGRKSGTCLPWIIPWELLDIIVASDASSDATDRIVNECDAPNVKLLRVEGRLGKTACQNAAAAIASGDILVFMDATTMTDGYALQAIARNFHDPSVGCVAGRLVYRARGTDATGKGGTSYWGYETLLRMAESTLGSLIGVSGQLYAVRRSAYRPIAPDLISDFVIAMVIREQGLRTVLEPGRDLLRGHARSRRPGTLHADPRRPAQPVRAGDQNATC